MPIPIRCPECGAGFRVGDHMLGKRVACKQCGERIVVQPAGPKAKKKKRKGKKSQESSSGLIIGLIVGVVLIGGLMWGAMSFLGQGGQEQVAQNEVVEAPGTDTDTTTAAPTGNTASPASQPTESAPPSQPEVTKTTTPQAPTGSGLKPATNTFANPARLSFNLSDWSLKADPPSESEFTSQSPLKVKLDPKNLTYAALFFPNVPSKFAGVKFDPFGKQPADIVDLTTGWSVITIPPNGGTVAAISPAARYAALSTITGPIGIFDIQSKSPLGEISTSEPDKFRINQLELPTPERLVGISQLDREVRVWELPSLELKHQMKFDDKFRGHQYFAYSPGGQYLAVCTNYGENAIEIYDLSTGKVAGKLSHKEKPSGCSLALEAVGFSRDGSQLGVLVTVSPFNSDHFTQFVVYDVASQKLVHDFDITPAISQVCKPVGYNYHLESFPNLRRWVIHGRGVIDCETKSLVTTFPPLDQARIPLVRKVMGDDWLAGIGAGGDQLETIPVSEEEFSSAASLAAKGGLGVDVGLPPHVESHYTEGLELQTPQGWSVTSDPGEAVQVPPFALDIDAGSGTARDLVVNSAGTVAAVRVAVDEQEDAAVRASKLQSKANRRSLGMLEAQPLAKQTYIDVFDTTTKQRTQRIELPFSASLLSISPNGERVLVQHHRGQGRLDIYDCKSGEHVLGWRPFRDEKKPEDWEVREAEFITNDRVATLGYQWVFALWQIPDAKPLYQLKSVRKFTSTPAGKHLVLLRGHHGTGTAMDVYETETGSGIGSMELKAQIDSLTFKTNGELLAMSETTDANSMVKILNYDTGEFVSSFPTPESADQMGWMGDNYIYQDGGHLVSTEFQAVAWSYFRESEPLATRMPGDRIWFVAHNGAKQQLRSLPLPDEQTAKRLTGTSLAADLLLKPGDAVSFTIDFPEVPELAEIRSGAEGQVVSRIQELGLQVSDSAPIEIRMAVKFESLGSTTVRKLGQSGEEISVDRKVVKIETTYNRQGKELWTSEVSRGNLDRILIRTKQTETIQAGIDRQMAEGVDRYFSQARLPVYLLSENSRNGLGSSKLSEIRP